MRKPVVFASLFIACFQPLYADTVVVFNEIMYHPATSEPTMEWVEFHNQHAVDVDLTGWTVTGGINFAFPTNTIIRGRGYLILAASPSTIMGATGFTNVVGPFVGRLSNGGDTLRLRNNSGRIMDEINYGVEGDWPVAPDGSGVSLAKIDRDLGSGPAGSWTASEQMGGTPSTDNFPKTAGFVPPSGLVSWWNFKEASGAALDQAGINHGTVGSGAIRTNGGIAGALTFTGTSNGFVNVGPGNGNDFAATTGISIEAVLAPGWSGTNSAVIFRKAIRQPGTYRDTVMANNPLAYWRMNDATTTIADNTSNLRNGTATAGVVLSQPSLIPSDPGNNAVRATGGERITVNGFEKIGPGGYTVEFWLKPHQLPAGCCQNLVGDGEGGGDYFLMNYMNGPQQGLVGAIRPHFGPANSPVSMDSPTALVVNNVYHVVSTWDTSVAANNAVIYLNGVLNRTGTISRNIPAAGTTGNNRVYIGFDDRSPGDGSFTYDEVALYNYPLTAQDVAAHYSAATVTNFAVDAGNAIQLAFQNDGKNSQANPAVPEGPVLSFGLTIGGVYSELDMPLDGQAGRPDIASMTNGQIHHVAATYDAATGLKAIFVDGVLRFSATLAGTISANNGANAILGNAEVNGSTPFVGTLDEMAFWRRALSSAEVLAHSTAIHAGRDYFAPAASAPSMTLAFNELSASTNSEFWLELVNYGTNAIPLEGFIVARDGVTNQEFIFPALSIPAGGYVAVTNTTLGFLPESGEKLYLLPPDRSKVLDSIVVKKVARARFPEGSGPWLSPSGSSAGSANTFMFHSEIVINEIMYNHAILAPATSNAPALLSNEEWIELYNHGADPVDLTGWELDGGIGYAFAPGQMIAAGGYLVVTKDTNALKVAYPAVEMIGNYSKSLSKKGDSIVLKDPAGNPADQVHYFDGGRWPEYADGGGSSLELRDPNTDNSKAEAWAASQESGKSSWNTYSYKMVAANIVGPVQWNEFIIGLLSSGECLVDDISVIEAPTTAPVQFISNGDFESGITGWRVVGTHDRSRVETDPDNAANHVLHVTATGPQEHMHNHIEATLANGRVVVNGREYQISFRAKWLAGNNLLNTRLYFDRVARTSVLPRPALNGTPGAQNSRFEGNIGPTFSGLAHQPIVPSSGQSVTVSVRAEDPQGIASCQVWFSANGGAWANATMTGADGFYSGTIPGVASGTVQFYVRAVDGLGAAATFPAAGPDSGALYAMNDGQANLPLAHNVRIIASPSNTSLLHAFTNVMSNDSLPCTVVYDEKRAYYNAAVRLKGSERGRYSDTRVSFHLEFQPDDLFRGVHPVMLIDRSGAGDSTANKQQEIVIRHMLLHASNIPGPQPDICRVIAPIATHTGPGIFGPRHEDQFLDTAFPGDSNGNMYELELIYYPTSATAAGYKNPNPDLVTGVDISDLGNDKELYRYDFIIKNNRDADDYGPFIAMAKTFSLPAGTALETQAEQVMDVDEWLRAFALVTLCGVGDSYTFGNNHNLLMYARPSDLKVVAFPWDMDFSFNRPATDALVGNQNLSKIINQPPNLRRFYGHILDIIATTYNASYVTYWANHYDDFCPGQSFAGVPGYVQTRGDFALGVINGVNSPFSIAGGTTILASNNLLLLSGTAPIAVRTIEVNGIPYPVTWTSLTGWSMRVPVSSATSTLEFRSYDLNGNLLPANNTTVTVNYSGPLVDARDAIVINEIMYKPSVSNAFYVEIFNTSSTFSFDLSRWRLDGIDYTFPRGTIITNRQILVIAKNRAAFAAAYGANIAVVGEFDGNLDPEGEKLLLVRQGATSEQDEIIDAVRFEDALPWPPAANGGGAALQLIDVAQDDSRVSNWSDGSNWRFHSFTGTPGAGATSLAITLDAAGDFYIDDISLVAGTVAGSGANLLQNGGFEAGLGPWIGNGNHVGSVVSTAVKHAGAASLHVIASSAGSSPNNAVSEALSGIVANNSYTLSFWYLPSTTVTGMNYRITSNFRSLSSISLKPSPFSPGAPNAVAAPIEPFPLLWINEIEPNNVTGITDNNGEHEPWVEIYNSGTDALSLDGYALAKSYDNLAQWSFPGGTTINPGEFKVIFADGQQGQSIAGELHTGFRLDPTNGSIVLSKNGRIIDYINYTNMDANFSYGSYPDGQVIDQQRFFYRTPGAPNNSAPVPIVINEWMAANTATTNNAATGRFDDWIELYNFGEITIDLSGFYLTDDLDQKRQWSFPTGTVISAQSFLFIWAGGETFNSTPSNLHANFGLSRNGDRIALYTPDLLLVDLVNFGAQQNDVSQGRYPDGNFGGVLYFMTAATPLLPNVLPANLSSPSLPAIANRTINEGTFLTFTNLASDSDLPIQTLTYSLDPGAPAGAIIDPVRGVFRWTPSEEQGGVVYSITVRVSDNGLPIRTDSKTFVVTVNKFNSPPNVPPLLSRTLPENTSVNFVVAASDSDLPVQSLAFSLDPGAPLGAVIDPVTGQFSWTPTEEQGPTTNVIVVRVTDDGSPSASTTQAVTIVVTEVNEPPVLINPGPATIDELKGYTNFLVATDSDLPTNRLTFSTVAPFISGVTIVSTTGRLTWTPSEVQGPTNVVITVRVIDNASPSMSATQSFTVTVNEVNSAPVMTNLESSVRTINELTSITLTNRATDSDVPTNTLTYEFLSAPAGATLNATNGLFTWTPAEGQGPGSNAIVVRVFDNGTPSLSATQRFGIVVNEVNLPPLLPPIADKKVAAGNLLTVTNVASDPDLPVQTLTYSFAGASPAGASLDGSTGLFAWRPNDADAPGTNVVTIRVADSGTPSLTATQAFRVVVVSSFRIMDIHVVDATHISITWQSENGKSYDVEYRDDLNGTTEWETLAGSRVIAAGPTSSFTVNPAGNSQRFYRVIPVERL